MSAQWTYKYNDNTIVVKNDGMIALVVNGEIQDKHEGVHVNNIEMTGKLSTGEEIKVRLGGFWKIKCNLFVDNKLQEPVEEL